MNKRHRITLLEDISSDGAQDPVYESTISGVPCNIVPVNGGDKYRGKQLQEDTQYVIEMRWLAGINSKLVAVNDITSVQYLINRVIDHQGRQREIIIEAMEAGPNDQFNLA